MEDINRLPVIAALVSPLALFLAYRTVPRYIQSIASTHSAKTMLNPVSSFGRGVSGIAWVCGAQAAFA